MSGLALALGLVKPQMIVIPLAVLLWKRQWQALAPVAAIGLPLVVLSVIASGPSVLLEYPRFAIDSAGWEGDGINFGQMFGLNGLLHTLTGEPPSMFLLAGPIVLTLGLTAWAFRGAWMPGSPLFGLRIGVALMASLLINAHLYLQDLVVLGLVFALVARTLAREDRAMVPWWGVLMVTLWAMPVAILPHLTSQGVSLMTPLMIATFGALLAQQERLLRKPLAQVRELVNWPQAA